VSKIESEKRRDAHSRKKDAALDTASRKATWSTVYRHMEKSPKQKVEMHGRSKFTRNEEQVTESETLDISVELGATDGRGVKRDEDGAGRGVRGHYYKPDDRHAREPRKVIIISQPKQRLKQKELKPRREGKPLQQIGYETNTVVEDG